MGLDWFEEQNWRKEWIGTVEETLSALYDKKKVALGYNEPPEDPEEVFGDIPPPVSLVNSFPWLSSSFLVGTIYVRDRWLDWP